MHMAHRAVIFATAQLSCNSMALHSLYCADVLLSNCSLTEYKIALLTYRSRLTNQPPYLRNLLHVYQPSHCLCSASQNLSCITSCTTNFSRHSFIFFAPTIWNELPITIKASNTLATFKRQLKISYNSSLPQRI